MRYFYGLNFFQNWFHLTLKCFPFLFQILSPHDKNIQKSILDNLEPSNENAFNEESIKYDDSNLIDPLEETSNAYFGSLKSILYDSNVNRNYAGKIIYTAMHGVGSDYIDQAFEISGFSPVIHVKEQRGKPKFNV